MKFVRFKIYKKSYYGLVKNGFIIRMEGSIFSKFRLTTDKFKFNQIKILPPVGPTKIICVGLNYKDHARELNMKIPKEPIIFLKPPTSIIGDGERIYCPSSSRRVDYEAELAIIIKKRCKDIMPKDASSVILGFTCLNDITARDLQQKDLQWTRAKSFDSFCPVGPFIVTGINPTKLRIRLLLNGKVRQDSNTKNLIFSQDKLISFISGIMTLLPGDIIATGTPFGVGPIKRGDEVTVDIEKIGRLTNYVI